MIDHEELKDTGDLIKTYIDEIYKDKILSKPEYLEHRFDILRGVMKIHGKWIKEDCDERDEMLYLKEYVNQHFEETAASASKLSKVYQNMRHRRHEQLMECIDKELNALAP